MAFLEKVPSHQTNPLPPTNINRGSPVQYDVEATNDTEKLHQYLTPTSKITSWRLVRSYSIITPEVYTHKYPGRGEIDDPFIVGFLSDDPVNPLDWPLWRRWMFVVVIGFGTLGVAFCASGYQSASPQLSEHFDTSNEVVTLGLSLFILGFAVGPMLWGPLSEDYGRQPLYFGTYAAMVVFNIAGTSSNSIASLVVCRFFAGAFGSSPLVVAGGVIADLFTPRLRAVGLAAWAACAFIGPSLGPVVSGFIAQNAGWRWVLGVATIFTGVMWIVGTLVVPETYGPVLLSRRAKKLTQLTGKTYISIHQKSAKKMTLRKRLSNIVFRPWALLIYEPIVLLISVYMSILYASLFLMLGAFPVVFAETRGWSQGISGLPFIGIVIGMISGAFHMMYDNKRYLREIQDPSKNAPEARLFPAMIGAIVSPTGMFLFAWTNSPSIHWIVCIIGITIYAHGLILINLTGINYLIDSYTIFAASVLAINGLLRAVLAAAFPLFTPQMYHSLGIHWASSIPAFLALACAPAPFVFFRYGKRIRMKCRYASQAHEHAIKQQQKLPESNDQNEVQVVEQKK